MNWIVPFMPEEKRLSHKVEKVIETRMITFIIVATEIYSAFTTGIRATSIQAA